MIQPLEHLVAEIGALHRKLLLLVGEVGIGKSRALATLAESCSASILNVGNELGRRLASLPFKQRSLVAPTILRELADAHVEKDLLLLDNIELLFDRTLKLDPLDLLKQLARARRVVAVWPGQLRDGRLFYAELGHPEHQDYGLDGIVPFAIQ